MIIQLVIGAIVASIFFKIQVKNTKMLNLIWNERFEHLQENTINYLLWMKDGCLRLQREYEKLMTKPNPIQGLIERLPSRRNKEFASKLKEANERTLTTIKNYFETHPESILPQLENAVDEITEQNNLIQITDEREKGNVKVLSKIIDKIDLLNKKYNVKKSGISPEPIYVDNLVNKIQKDKLFATLMFFIPGIIILSIPIIVHNLIFRDILNDWVTYLGIFLTVLGLSLKSEKDWVSGLWFIIGGIVMLALGLSVGFNALQF